MNTWLGIPAGIDVWYGIEYPYEIPDDDYEYDDVVLTKPWVIHKKPRPS